jgi:hypothetical protein
VIDEAHSVVTFTVTTLLVAEEIRFCVATAALGRLWCNAHVHVHRPSQPIRTIDRHTDPNDRLTHPIDRHADPIDQRTHPIGPSIAAIVPGSSPIDRANQLIDPSAWRIVGRNDPIDRFGIRSMK